MMAFQAVLELVCSHERCALYFMIYQPNGQKVFSCVLSPGLESLGSRPFIADDDLVGRVVSL